ncbi:MAG TPA: HAD family phosphatase [Acidimicrobiia bacterium]|nr:HAD family phosphatase [Acidimicrobiia bacterium]
MTISTVIFDFGGVISSPLFVGMGAFEEAEGYPRGSLLQLIFGETHYIGVEGRAVAEALAADPDAAEAQGEVGDEPDWHLLEKGRLDVATYFDRVVEKAPAVLGRHIDMETFGRFWRTTAPGVHWTVVHKMRDLKARGLRLGLLTNNVKEFGDNWRAMFPIDELCETVVDSSHVGMRKPERAIYALTCERMRITPAEAVFVDDNADNVEAARAFGMHAVHFIEPDAAMAELEEILAARGVTRS